MVLMFWRGTDQPDNRCELPVSLGLTSRSRRRAACTHPGLDPAIVENRPLEPRDEEVGSLSTGLRMKRSRDSKFSAAFSFSCLRRDGWNWAG